MSGLRNTIIGFLLFCSGSVALAATETVRDEFSSGGYTGNDGSQSWASSWQEHENGGGGSGGGNIRVSGNELRLRGNTTSSNPNSQNRIEREVNLTDAGASSATLSFDWRGSASLETNDLFFIEVSNDGGASFTVIDTLIGDDMENSTGSFSMDISGFIATNTTTVRLRNDG